MAFVHSFAAMIALFVAPLAAWVAFGFFRDGASSHAAKSVAVAVVAGMIWLTAPKNETRYSDNCFIDWDARSNATVCD